MTINRFASWFLLAPFLLVAGCTTPKRDSAQLDELLRRTCNLEQQVHDLEVSNAELQKQMRALQERHEPRVPDFSLPQNPGAPRRSQPPSNGVPHLTPLEIK
jgi:hypothetical protein